MTDICNTVWRDDGKSGDFHDFISADSQRATACPSRIPPAKYFWKQVLDSQNYEMLKCKNIFSWLR